MHYPGNCIDPIRELQIMHILPAGATASRKISTARHRQRGKQMSAQGTGSCPFQQWTGELHLRV